MRKILISWLLCLFFCHIANAGAMNIKVVEIFTTKLANISETVKLTGVVHASAHANLRAKENDIISKIYVLPSSKVTKNTLIASLKSYELAKEKEAIALKQVTRITKLNQQNIASDASLEAARMELLAQKQNLEHSAFYAAFDGVVGVFKLKEGEEISRDQVLVTIYNADQLYLAFNLPEHLIDKVKLGQTVLVNNRAEKIIAMQHVIDHQTHLAPAESSLDCKTCIIGSLLDLELVIANHPKTLIIPYQAIFFKQGQPFIYTVSNKNKIVERSLTLGIRQKDQVEVINGVELGDQVVVKGHGRLHEGEEVIIHTETTK